MKTTLTDANDARAKIANLLAWETTNDYSTADLIATLYNVMTSRVTVNGDGSVELDGVLLDDDRLTALANQLPD